MSYKNGRVYTCDRCGASCFVVCTGEGERDGGYTRWNTFERLPDSWESHSEVGLLCPTCNSKWQSIVDNFKAGADKVEES